MTGTDTVAAPPAIKSIHHIGITVSDVERAESWYSRVLGLNRFFVEKHHGSDAGGYAVVIGNEAGTFNVGLDHNPGNDGSRFSPEVTGLDHFSFHVGTRDDLLNWVEHLDSQGVAHSGVFDIEGMPYAVLNFRDEDGIAIEFISVN